MGRKSKRAIGATAREVPAAAVVVPRQMRTLQARLSPNCKEVEVGSKRGMRY